MPKKDNIDNMSPEYEEAREKKPVKKPSGGGGQNPKAKNPPPKKGKGNAKPEPKKGGKSDPKDDVPPSSKVIHQFMPFLLGALALLLGVFIIGSWFGDMGIVGDFVSMLAYGLFSFGAFLVPFAILALAIFWRKMIDDRRTALKTIPAVLTVLQISILVHVFSGSVKGTFNVSELWSAGTELRGGGLIGGLICEAMLVLFKEIGTAIIAITTLLVSLMILFNVTPKNIWTYIRYKSKVASEKREEKLAMKAAESEENEEDEGNGEYEEEYDEENEQEYEEEEPVPVVAVPKKEKAKPETVEKPHKKQPAPDIMASMPPPPPDEIPEDDKKSDEMSLEEIFAEKRSSEKSELVSIDLSTSDDTDKTDKPEKKPAPETAIKKPADDVTISMKVDDEQLSDLENLRGGDAEETEEEEFIDYMFPPTELMKEDTNREDDEAAQAEMNENAQILKETLASFNIGIKDNILCSRGPTITRYELRPEVGVRVRSIANLVDDIALSLASSGVRIEAPIPNKPYVGIEVPNHNRMTVFLRTLIEHEKFTSAQSKLTACLGADVGGNPVFFDIAKMPHLLIAGATGMGKSVCINSIIVSILYKATPDEVKLILIDPKKVEFNIYKEIPHLYAPVVSDPKKAAGALASAVAEMERRFELIEAEGVRDINNYNAAVADDPSKEYMPKMVIIIDELADLMMTAPGEVESSICRLAQKARAAGIHIIIGTQRPSVDVITGLIKANVPSRIACTVSSQVDSRTIIDIAGAEKLIGKGDMLFAPVGISKPMRVQGAFISEGEVESIVEFIKNNNRSAEYNKDFISVMESEAAKCGNGKKGASGGGGDDGMDGETDPKFREAVKLAIDAGKISTSLMQRNLGVGYGRAAKIIDQMEDLGYVSPPDGNKPRRVLITMQEFMEKVVNDDLADGGASAPSEESEE